MISVIYIWISVLLLSPLPFVSQEWDSIHMTLKNYTGQHPQCFPPHFLRFFHDDDTPDSVPSNQEEIRIKRKGRKDVICYSNYNPMNYENGWCHTKVGNMVAKNECFKKVFFSGKLLFAG